MSFFVLLYRKLALVKRVITGALLKSTKRRRVLRPETLTATQACIGVPIVLQGSQGYAIRFYGRGWPLPGVQTLTNRGKSWYQPGAFNYYFGSSPDPYLDTLTWVSECLAAGGFVASDSTQAAVAATETAAG